LEKHKEILVNIDIFLLKGCPDKALNLFTRYLVKFMPSGTFDDCEVFINILAMTYVWPEYKLDTNCIIIRTLAQRRIANSQYDLICI